MEIIIIARPELRKSGQNALPVNGGNSHTEERVNKEQDAPGSLHFKRLDMTKGAFHLIWVLSDYIIIVSAKKYQTTRTTWKPRHKMNLVMPKYNSQVLKPKIVDPNPDESHIEGASLTKSFCCRWSSSSIQIAQMNSSHPKHGSQIKSMLKELSAYHRPLVRTSIPNTSWYEGFHSQIKSMSKDLRALVKAVCTSTPNPLRYECPRSLR